MTLAELLAIARWADGHATFTLDVPLFGGGIKFEVLADHDRALTERTAETVRQVQALDASDMARIVEVVWDNYVLNMETTGYGLEVREGQTETEANLDDFGIHDAATAYARTTLKYCLIIEDKQSEYTANYATLFMDNEWETHGVDIVIRNGRVVGGGENGLWIGQFEPDADKA